MRSETQTKRLVLAALMGFGAGGFASPAGAQQNPDSVAEVQGPGSPTAATAPATAAEFLHRVARITEYLEEFVDTSVVPGVSVALGVGDAFTRVESFGYADLDEGRRVTPYTRFRVGSVSKALTAVALARLVQHGTLDLDAAVRRYVPEFGEKGDAITLRQLAAHQAGIRHYRGDEAYSDRHYESVLDAISVFSGDALVAEPGTTTSYSTYGYTLLSAAMERGAGTPFLTLMQDSVIEPLGMRETGPESQGPSAAHQATGYEVGPDGGAWLPPRTDLSNKWAGGGYVSTAGDLLRFARAHLGDGALPGDVRSLVWEPQTTRDGTRTPFGIGWQVARMPDAGPLLVAGGSAIGGTAVVFVFPETEVAVVFLTNMGNAPIRGVPMRVARLLMGMESP